MALHTFKEKPLFPTAQNRKAVWKCSFISLCSSHLCPVFIRKLWSLLGTKVITISSSTVMIRTNHVPFPQERKTVIGDERSGLPWTSACTFQVTLDWGLEDEHKTLKPCLCTRFFSQSPLAGGKNCSRMTKCLTNGIAKGS